MGQKMDAADLAGSLATGAGEAARRFLYSEGEVIFLQGDDADSVFYIKRGRVKCMIASKSGKTGVVAIHKTGQFFGESCIIGHAKRVMTATAMTPCSLIRIEKLAMACQLHRQPALAEEFISFLVSQSLQYERDLVDHLFNSAEKRLARVLMLLSSEAGDQSDGLIPRMSQESLAEIVGTTRSRINHFMNKFRRLGFVDYNGQIRVRRALLKVILQDDGRAGA